MKKMRNIAEYGKMLAEKGFVIGAGGNISERAGEYLIIKKKGAWMSSGAMDDYARVGFKEAVCDKSLSSETPLHIACYEARSDIGAVMHVHSPIIIACAQNAEKLESVSYEFDCIIQKPVPSIGYIQPGSRELAGAVGEEIKRGANAVMLKQHGAVSVGSDLEEAYLRVLALERACLVWLHTR